MALDPDIAIVSESVTPEVVRRVRRPDLSIRMRDGLGVLSTRAHQCMASTACVFVTARYTHRTTSILYPSNQIVDPMGGA